MISKDTGWAVAKVGYEVCARAGLRVGALVGQYTNMDESRWLTVVGNAVVDTLGGGLKISSLSLPALGNRTQPVDTPSVPLREVQAASFHILLVGTAAMF